MTNAIRVSAVVLVGALAVSSAQAILGPADNYGGLVSFQYMVPLCAVLALIFGLMYAADRRSGGYSVKRIGAEA